MMACLQGGNLPALEVQTTAIAVDTSLSLTEVVCIAIYGKALKAGNDPGSLESDMADLRQECGSLWRNVNGPGWLRSHMGLLSSGRSWAFPSEVSKDCKTITLSWFAAAQRWLKEGRKLGAARELPPQLAEKARRLAQMTDAEAISCAIAEADRIERAESAINARSAAFYGLLNRAVMEGRVTLKAVPTDPETNTWSPIIRGEPPHRRVPIDFFELPLVHDLRENTLEFDNFSTNEKMVVSIFDRNERAKEAALVKWADLKVSADDARWLLSTFSVNQKPRSQLETRTLDEKQAYPWPPNWLSLAGAIMWVATRDKTLTEKTEAQIGNDSGIVAGVVVRLAYEKAADGVSRTLFVDTHDAWPALRRLIADEKIVAEGRSLERRGVYAAVEQRYPNEKIPSGDAANLIILGSVSGIEPKDALGPNELYRFANGQGRYWYDVRLRADDVFREFRDPKGEGRESRKTQSCPGRKREARGDAELLKVAFKQCFPEGVPRGMWVKEVYRRMSEWIKTNRERHPPSWKTFDRQRSKFWPKDS